MAKLTDLQRAINALVDKKAAIEHAIAALEEQKRARPTRPRKLKPVVAEVAR